MTKTNSHRELVLVVMVLLLVITLALQLAGGVVTARAGGDKYEVVSLRPVNTSQELEKVLNETASEGWEYVETITAQGGMAVFKK